MDILQTFSRQLYYTANDQAINPKDDLNVRFKLSLYSQFFALSLYKCEALVLADSTLNIQEDTLKLLFTQQTSEVCLSVDVIRPQ